MRLNKKRILVIKHGALGDIINTTGAFKLIRHHHSKDHIVCLTSPLYEKFMKEMPYFDEIWLDPRTKGLKGLLHFGHLLRKLRGGKFDYIYDFQGSCRTGWYKGLITCFSPSEWKGIPPHQKRKEYHALHTSVRFTEQLKRSSIKDFKPKELEPDLSWLKADVDRFQIPEKMILLVPGSSQKGLYKRWPAPFYGMLAQLLLEKGYHPVFIGGPDEQDLMTPILEKCPKAQNWVGQTNFFDIAGLARNALALIGNDTGPTHMGAATGCLTVFLWSKASDPEIYAPRGNHIRVLYEPDLHNLSVAKVQKAFEDFLKKS